MQSSSPTLGKEGPGRRGPRVQVPCKSCKRRQMPWKGFNPRRQPYEQADAKCSHQSGSLIQRTCLNCLLPLKENGNGLQSCANLECPQLQHPELSWPPKDDVSVTKATEQAKPIPPLILRTHCRNCRIESILCSGSITGPRCERCEELDLECDCKVRRKSCAECMKGRWKVDWKRCVGIHDACDGCIEMGIECKEFVPGAESECSGERGPKGVVARGPMDIIDGMKATRAFTTCERCLEEQVRCDWSLPGCGRCAEKGVACKYRLLAATISDFSGEGRTKRPTRRSSLLNGESQTSESGPSRANQRKDEERHTQDDKPIRSPRFPIACDSCRRTLSRCSGTLPTCDRCKRLGTNCRPPKQFRVREVGIKKNDDSLDQMMSDLELDGWHVVSHEEVEEAVKVESERT